MIVRKPRRKPTKQGQNAAGVAMATTKGVNTRSKFPALVEDEQEDNPDSNEGIKAMESEQAPGELEGQDPPKGPTRNSLDRHDEESAARRNQQRCSLERVRVDGSAGIEVIVEDAGGATSLDHTHPVGDRVMDVQVDFNDTISIEERNHGVVPGLEIWEPVPVPVGPVPKFLVPVPEPVGTGSKTGHPVGFQPVFASCIIQQETALCEGTWIWAWRAKVTQWAKVFIWLALYDKIMTNAIRARQGLTTDSSCPICGDGHETVLDDKGRFLGDRLEEFLKAMELEDNSTDHNTNAKNHERLIH
ncbi:hypothetical protein Cgig2_026762 [Carnegiea gigantea]|uniref:Reverse transcriptase zinc-binding domain-containing protein n=1 Tax=Carnegiea gigantea TaxID=171969 RepID=A0A9Q1JSC9_9CARY|nr:hypothetical protein Cgig2_026762 [Carnegiea gigantea]